MLGKFLTTCMLDCSTMMFNCTLALASSGTPSFYNKNVIPYVTLFRVERNLVTHRLKGTITEFILIKDSCFSLSGERPSMAFSKPESALKKCGNDTYNGASENTYFGEYTYIAFNGKHGLPICTMYNHSRYLCCSGGSCFLFAKFLQRHTFQCRLEKHSRESRIV